MSLVASRYPHRIRLANVWQLFVEEPGSGRPRRYRIGPWSAQGLPDYRGPARLRRSFGRPRTISANERAILAIGGCDAATTVLLNGRQLAQDCERWSILRFDVTELLERRNQVELRMSPMEDIARIGRPFGGVLWGVELQIWPLVWVDYALAIVTAHDSDHARVTCAVAIDGLPGTQVITNAQVYLQNHLLGKSTTHPVAAPREFRLDFDIPLNSELLQETEAPHSEAPWLVGNRRVDPSEVFRAVVRLQPESDQIIELELPAGLLAGTEPPASPPMRDLLSFVHAPELALSDQAPREPATMMLRTPPLTATSLPYLVARIGGHPLLSGWAVTGAAEEADELATRLAELDPIRPVRRLA